MSERDVGGVVGGMEYAYRTALEAEIASQRMEPTSKNIQTLIDLMVADIRLENDTAMVKGLIRNQGKIAGLLQLKDVITKDFLALQEVMRKKA